MLTKTLFASLLIIFIVFPSSAISFTTKTFQNSQDTELTFYSSSIAVTPQNKSSFISTIISLGMVYGGSKNYLFLASLTEDLSYTINIYLQRSTQSIYIVLDSVNSFWNGNISFSGCCSMILENLYASFSIFSQPSNISSNGTLFRLDFVIYKLPITGYSGYLSSGVINALGFPYPTKTYIISLMITIIGIIPEAIGVKLLIKLTRKKQK